MLTMINDATATALHAARMYIAKETHKEIGPNYWLFRFRTWLDVFIM